MSDRPARGATPQERSAAARARLLAAASELFYAEGVQTVGIDRVIEHAGVAKATLYSAFGSKEALVRAYLRARHDATRERMSRELAARFPSARAEARRGLRGAGPVVHRSRVPRVRVRRR